MARDTTTLTAADFDRMFTPEGESIISVTDLVERVAELEDELEHRDMLIEAQRNTILQLRLALAQSKTLH